MALVTSEEIQEMTGLGAGDDTAIQTFIPIVQSEIENFCDRLFDVDDYSEWHPYSYQILTEQYPINQLKFIGWKQQVAEFTDTSNENDLYNYEIIADKITGEKSSLVVTDANVASTSFSFDTYTSLFDVKTIVESTIPAVTLTIQSGWDNVNYKLFKEGAGRTVYVADRSDGQAQVVDNRTIDLSSYFGCGFYDGYSADSSSTFIIYSAGYETSAVPQALKRITSAIIEDLINVINSKVTSIYKSEKLTNYSYQLADPDQIKQSIKKYEVALDYYRKKIL